MPGKKILEIACFNMESALIAQSAGADRIEFCENYSAGGITPSQKTILEVRAKAAIPVHVIIRPRAGDFVYSEKETETIKNDILFCKQNNIDGIVVGVLTKDRKIDLKLCQSLITLARPMSVTFHRAIDECMDLESSMKDLISLGVNRVLTSGGKKNALEGISELTNLQSKFGEKLVVMPGGGIRASNISEILKTACHQFHSAALTQNHELAAASEIKNLKHLLSGQA